MVDKRDPGQLASAFLAGPQLDADHIDVDNDLLPIFWRAPNGEYIPANISPRELWEALQA